MKPSFHVKQLNGPFDDPCLHVRILRESRAFMFDLGFHPSLSPRDILKTTDIFVSHMHIDHFIGFDNVLRVSLKKKVPLKFYGPDGLINSISARLGGYSWNLIRDYPLTIEAIELKDKCLNKTVFRAENSFAREDHGSERFDGVLMKDSVCSVSSVVLDHQIPCLAFSLEEDYHINIDKARLTDMNLPVGPWLGELKRAMRNNEEEKSFEIGGRSFSLAELRSVARITKGQKIAYVVDAAGSEENIEKIVALVRGTDVLYIEGYFLNVDKERAETRSHLTAREAGRIAREAGAGRLEIIHISPRYMNEQERILREAEKEYLG